MTHSHEQGNFCPPILSHHIVHTHLENYSGNDKEMVLCFSLRKHAHAINGKKIGCKNENFHWNNFIIFLIFTQNIDCGYTFEPPRQGGSNEYPQSMFWGKNKKKRYTPAYPSFTI